MRLKVITHGSGSHFCEENISVVMQSTAVSLFVISDFFVISI